MLTTKQRTFKNISYSLLSFGWPVLIALFITPIIVRYFGIKEYGIYIFINTLVSLVGLLDLGVSTAISKFIAERQGDKDEERIKNLFKTTNTILVIIGVTGGLAITSSIFLGIFLFPANIINTYQVYIPAFVYAAIIFFINSISGLYTIIPIAYQRFDISSKIGIALITVQQIAILVVVLLNWSINTLFLLHAIITLFFYFIYKKYVTQILSTHECLYITSYGWDKVEAIKCYKFGIASFVNNLSGSSLTYFDRVIIPIFLGPSNLAFYSLPGSITSKIPTLSATLSAVVFPMVSYLDGSGDRVTIKNLYMRSMRLIVIISTAVSITIIAFAYQLLTYWINADVANKATDILIILAITNLFLAIISPLNNFLLGMGKLKDLTVTSFAAAITNIGLLIIFLPKFGIVGAAWAYLLALTPYIYLIYRTEKFSLGLTFRKLYYFRLISKLLVISIFIYVIDVNLIKPYIDSFILVIIASLVSCVMFITMYYLFGFFEKEDSDDILSFIKKQLSNYLFSVTYRNKNK